MLPTPVLSIPTIRQAISESSRGQWWTSVFEASEDAQLVCQSDGAVIEANRRAFQLLGFPANLELPAHVLPSFLTEGTARKLSELLQRSAGRQETLAAVSLLTQGRLSLVADLQVIPLGDGCSLVAVKDASRRWRMESHVQRLITAINSTTDVLYLTDASFRLTFVNPAFQQVTGHTIEDALGRDPAFLRSPAQERKAEACRQAVTTGKDWRGELINVRRDGPTYPVEAAVSPIYDKNGVLLGCVTFERDISSQKRLQEDLQLERDYTQSIINSVDAAVYTLDHELCLRHFNRSWESFPAGHGGLSFEGPPQIGRPLLEYISDEARRKDVQRVLLAVLADGQPREIRGSVGDSQQWLVKVTPWTHQAQVLGLNYVVVDQTRFCQLQTQLFQSQKMETIGALAAGVAHDFNNLLLAIRGNVTLLQLDGSVTAPILARLRQIDNAANRAAEITKQLLSFSRAAEEREVVVDFNQLVREASQLARRTLKGKVELQLELPETPVKVRIDATRGNQLLLNLAVNAADAMPGGGRLTIKNTLVQITPDQAQRFQRPAEGSYLCCAVRDTGTGIPPEVLPRIFDPFFTTKAKGKGTGLGLAIVHNIVTRAGGFVEIETVLGRGTTFFIYLPAVTACVAEEAKAPDPELLQGHGRILIVDDMDFILEFTQSFLVTAGYDVLTALSADAAIKVLEEQGGKVDVLLTDYNMPGRTGLALVVEAKARWPHIRCIVASGYLEEEEVERIQSELGARILYKPYNIGEATVLVGRVLASPVG